MKKLFTIFLALIVLLLIAGFTGLKSKKYNVEILQNGQAIEIINNEVELDKKEFQIRITLKKQDGVFMSASFQRNYFDLNKNDSIKDYKWLNCKAFAENEFNKDKKLFIDDELVSYLFYDKKYDWHRFDKEIIVKGKEITGTKTIKYLYIMDTKTQIDLKNIDKDIYLFFVATEKWVKGETPKECGRLKIRIKWK